MGDWIDSEVTYRFPGSRAILQRGPMHSSIYARCRMLPTCCLSSIKTFS